MKVYDLFDLLLSAPGVNPEADLDFVWDGEERGGPDEIYLRRDKAGLFRFVFMLDSSGLSSELLDRDTIWVPK